MQINTSSAKRDVGLETGLPFFFLDYFFCVTQSVKKYSVSVTTDETKEMKEDRVDVSEGTGAFNVSIDTTCCACCAWLVCVQV